MKEKTAKKYVQFVLRIVLTVACVIMLGFIFSNSLKTAEQSTAQSSTVVDAVQKVAQAVAPESKIANATGDAYDRLHEQVRSWAHFFEFLALGALFGWCYFSYTLQKRYLYVSACAVIIVPVIDELLQIFSAGRGFSFADVLVDVCGGLVGIGVAAVTVLLGLVIYRKKIKRREIESANCSKSIRS